MKILTTVAFIFAVMCETRAGAQPTAQSAPSAEDLYAQGEVAYKRADWPTAITKWQASYQLSGEIGLLFNIAQAQRQSGDCSGALGNYRRYLASDTDLGSEQHTIAEDFARDLESQCGTPAPVLQASPARNVVDGLNVAGPLNDPKDREARPGRTLKISGLVVGGAGVAALMTGLIYGHHAQTIAGEVTSACRTSCDWTAWQGKDAQGRHDATIGRVLDGVGAAGIVGGVALYYVGVRQSAISIAPRSHEGGAVVSWSGTW